MAERIFLLRIKFFLMVEILFIIRHFVNVNIKIDFRRLSAIFNETAKTVRET
ncbi:MULTISPECIES: hypothetical protein [unclassified Chryseobacterium]|uniref:hypothetical protein n=1 Tax=unclassified Chryseobacterium TaxID=2593645 RepID=UPI0013E99964|nr:MULTISPECIES: hypothetical protein [unclassified Chryseobacterium]